MTRFKAAMLASGAAGLLGAGVTAAFFGGGGMAETPRPPHERMPDERPELWRAVSPQALLVVTTDRGDAVIELALNFASAASAETLALVRRGAFEGARLERSEAGVRLWATASGADVGSAAPTQAVRPAPGVFVDYGRRVDGGRWGSIDGFAVVERDEPDGTSYQLLACPGAVGLVRDAAGGGIGLTLVKRVGDLDAELLGRVVAGVEAVEIPETSPDTVGRIEGVAARVTLGPPDQATVYVMRPESQAFASSLVQARDVLGPEISPCDLPPPGLVRRAAPR